MELNIEALHAACLGVARETLWKSKGEKKSTVKEIEAHAAKLQVVALHHLEFIAEQGRDPNILVRAVRYLAHTHAIPPMRGDTGWYTDMLEVLIELACPNTDLPPKGKDFVADLRKGLSAKLKV